MFSTLIEAFSYQVLSQPDRTALIYETSQKDVSSCTWRELAAAVGRCAADLELQFEQSPDLPRRVGHASDNGLADVVIALSAASIGAVEVPIDHRLSEQEIDARWSRVGGIWFDQERRESLDVRRDYQRHVVVAQAGHEDEPSLILWTSGTSGSPQGVVLSARNLAGNAAAKLVAVPQQREDIRLTVLPLSHAYARTCDFGTWLLSGCTLAVTLGYDGFQRMAPLVRPTLMNTVPRMAGRVFKDDPVAAGLEQLRLLGCGGAPISDAEFMRWKDRGVTVIQGYGLTEASPVICSATPENASPGLVGHPVDGWETDIRDGQLFVRGPHTMLGYWNDTRATTTKIDSQGWLGTGDLVQTDPLHGGQFRILGRADDVIVLDSGRKIFPSTVQREVEQIDTVRHAILVQQGLLQLWFDADDDCNEDQITGAIEEALARQHCRPCEIHRFTPPLCEASGELTSKGTVRRDRVIENRFLAHAGS